MSDEFEKHASYDIDFSYLIWQNDVKRERVYYYLDGDSVRRIMRMADFHKMAYMKSPDIASLIQSHCNDYSFHMWNAVDKTVVYLSPNGKSGEYEDLVMTRINKRSPHIIKEKSTDIFSQLNQLGFNSPHEKDVLNLNVYLTRKEPEDEGLLSRLFKRGR
jgi:hypothetical protein